MSLGCDCRLGEKLMLEKYILKVEITELTGVFSMNVRGPKIAKMSSLFLLE